MWLECEGLEKFNLMAVRQQILRIGQFELLSLCSTILSQYLGHVSFKHGQLRGSIIRARPAIRQQPWKHHETKGHSRFVLSPHKKEKEVWNLEQSLPADDSCLTLTMNFLEIAPQHGFVAASLVFQFCCTKKMAGAKIMTRRYKKLTI